MTKLDTRTYWVSGPALRVAIKRTPKSEATMGRYVYTDYDLCIGCHICADVCPTGYIKMGMGDH